VNLVDTKPGFHGNENLRCAEEYRADIDRHQITDVQSNSPTYRHRFMGTDRLPFTRPGARQHSGSLHWKRLISSLGQKELAFCLLLKGYMSEQPGEPECVLLQYFWPITMIHIGSGQNLLE